MKVWSIGESREYRNDGASPVVFNAGPLCATLQPGASILVKRTVNGYEAINRSTDGQSK